MKVYTEQEARKMPNCPGCGEPKGYHTIVCWRCFNSREWFTPFKYYAGTFESWQMREVWPYWEEQRAKLLGPYPDGLVRDLVEIILPEDLR